MDNWVLGYVWRLRRNRVRDQKGLWVTSFFRQIGYALISGLSVVFVYELGRDRFWVGGVKGRLLLLLLFVFLIRLTVVLVGIWMGRYLIRRIGYRRSIILSLFFSVMAFMSMAAASYWMVPGLVLVSGVIFGLIVTTYWVTYQTMIPDDSDESSVGSVWGKLEAISMVGQAAAPVIGAMIAVRFGFESLFVFGMVFMGVAGLPMFFLGRHLHLDDVSWGEFWSWLKAWTYMKFGVATVGRMLHQQVYTDLWPVYVFLMLGSLTSIGWLKSITFVSTAVFTYLVAKRFDKSSNKRMQLWGVCGGVVMWVVRSLVVTTGQVFLVDTVDRFFNSMHRVYFFGKLTRRAKGEETFSFMVYWEVLQSFGVVLLTVVLMGVVILGGVEYFWPLVFGVAAMGLILSLLIEEHHRA